MKRLFLLFYLIFFAFSLYALDFKIYRDEIALTCTNEINILIKKNTIVKMTNFFIYEKDSLLAKKVKSDNVIIVSYDGRDVAINIDSIIPAETKKLFDDNLISYKQKEKGKFISSLTELEILKSNTRDSYYNIHKERIDAYEKERGIYDTMEWYEGVSFNEYDLNNLFIIVGDSKKYNFYYLIRKIEKIKGGYIVSCELTDINLLEINYINDDLEKLLNQNEIKYKLIIDGDYINFFDENDKLLFTLVYVDKSVVEQYERLFQEGKANLNKVTWPRHADGSCDYDGSSKKVSAANTSQSKAPVAGNTNTNTNVAVKKTMSVAENLKLRSGEATSTQVLTVMSAGTKVKIFELGKAETIDGINSNWVKVEVQAGAKDRDGKEIKAGTVGWCYGGYLK